MGWGEEFEAQGGIRVGAYCLEVAVSKVTGLTMSVKRAPDGDPRSNANGFQFAKILSKPQTSYLKPSPAPNNTHWHLATGSKKNSLSVA